MIVTGRNAERLQKAAEQLPGLITYTNDVAGVYIPGSSEPWLHLCGHKLSRGCAHTTCIMSATSSKLGPIHLAQQHARRFA